MKQIILSELTMLNFKGIRNLTVKFNGETSDSITTISGDNATGKTTIYDAFLWCLFGKDSQGRADFNVKTLDAEGNVIPRIPHEVTVELRVRNLELGLNELGVENYDLGVNNSQFSIQNREAISPNSQLQTLKLTRALNEKWIRKAGDESETFSGNETVCFINDINVKVAEYKAKIQELCDETVFTLITNTEAFMRLPESEQRNFLYRMITNATDEEIAALCADPDETLQMLKAKGGISFESFRKALNAQRAQLNEQAKDIPARIDEKRHDISLLYTDKDEKQLIEQEKLARFTIKELQDKLNDATAVTQEAQAKISELMRERLAISNNLSNREHALRQELTADYYKQQREYQALQFNVKSLSDQKQHLEAALAPAQQRTTQAEQTLEMYRKQYEEAAKQQLQLSDKDLCCPTCKRPLEGEGKDAKINQLQKTFDYEKQARLRGIAQLGNDQKDLYTSCLQEQSKLERELKTVKLQLEAAVDKMQEFPPVYQPSEEQLKATIDADPEVQRMRAELSDKEQLINNLKAQTVDETARQVRTELQENINKAQHELECIQADQQSLKTIALCNRRIEELEALQTDVYNQLSEKEHYLYLIDEFSRTKAHHAWHKINGLFSCTKFKLFEPLVNGTLAECCKATFNGVPYRDLNNAQKINTGLDIINAISNYYQIAAPVFIDNAEAVNEITKLHTQSVQLKVARGELRVI